MFKIFHLVSVLALILMISFSFVFCAYTSFGNMGMGSMHVMDVWEDHIDHAQSLVLAIVPTIISLVLIIVVSLITYCLAIFFEIIFKFVGILKERFRLRQEEFKWHVFNLRSPPILG